MEKRNPENTGRHLKANSSPIIEFPAKIRALFEAEMGA